MSANRCVNRAGPVATSRPTNADVPLPSIERDASSPTGSGSASPSGNSIPVIYTPSASTSPDPASPSSRSQLARSGSVELALGRMNLQSPSVPGRIENLSDIADATDAVARGSDSRSASLAPEDSVRLTPQRSPRSRRSISRAPRHEVKDEELPEDAFHDPSFQAAYRDAKLLMARMHDTLGSASIHNDPDSTMQRLHHEAGELARFTYPHTRKVGFVGDSGVGKSSLLNCLLDFRDLARASNSGEACTCVATEYHYHSENTFSLEVELFSLDDIMDQLSAMLSDYRWFHLSQDEIDEPDMQNSEALANQARDTILSMLRGRIADETFLLQDTEARVLERLNELVVQARPSQISRLQTGLSPASCSSTLVELSSESNSRTEPAKWPFIRKIKVFLNAHILSKGLILVDLPGLRDLNSARRAITERFLLECNEIFVICNIGRAVTDEGVQCVFELARQAQLSNVSIVCTRSDDIQPDEARRDWPGERAREIKKLQGSIATYKRKLGEIEAEIGEYEQDDEDLLDEDKDELNRLNRQYRQLEKRTIPARKLELHAYLVNNRNSDVERELKNQYRERASNGEVRVFCISNTGYWSKREYPVDEALPTLQLSGILGLRKYCISIVANSQRRISAVYMHDRIPALLAQIRLWVQSGAGTADAERKRLVRDVLTEIRNRIEMDLRHHSSQINQISAAHRRDFRDQIYDRRDISSWSDAAIEAQSDWAGWSHPTYSAFCRNDGNHHTAAVGSRNWNEEAIDEMASDLRMPWMELTSHLESRQQEIEDMFNILTEWSIEILEDRLSDMPEITGPLVNALISQKDVLCSNIENAHEEFDASLRILRTDALSGIQTSLIGKVMMPAYRSCKWESGTGSHARRKAIINRVLSDQNLFPNLMRDFRNAFKELSEGLQEKAQVATLSFLDDIDMTLDIVLDENVALESEQDPAFRRRVDEAVRAGNEEVERIRAAISG